MTLLLEFDKLTEFGLKIIPLHPNSKIPIFKDWNKTWNRSFARKNFEKNSNLNMGIILGEILDIEGDSQEANDFIKNLIKDYPHPCYESSKSVHHIFLSPFPKLTIKKFSIKTKNDLEFRGCKHQSVLPPSKIGSTIYNWIKRIEQEIPLPPDSVIKFLEKSIKKDIIKNSIKPNHLKVRCFICEKQKFIHQKRFDLELKVFKKLGLRWTCHYCRNLNITKFCKKIRGKQSTNFQL